jgi:hypothetical protein
MIRNDFRHWLTNSNEIDHWSRNSDDLHHWWLIQNDVLHFVQCSNGKNFLEMQIEILFTTYLANSAILQPPQIERSAKS